MTRYGFIRTKEEIKFLVLYAMQYLDFPISFESVVDICTWCDDGFSYFDLQEAFDEMVHSGHMNRLECHDDPIYEITAMGREAAEIFETDLPYTVREAAQASALRVMRKLQRDAAIASKVEMHAENDFIVQLDMQDVFSIRMNVVSRSQAALLEKNFQKHAEQIYHVLLDALVKEYDEETENR